MTPAELLAAAQALYDRCDAGSAAERRLAAGLALVLGDGDAALAADLGPAAAGPVPPVDPAQAAEGLAGIDVEDGRLVPHRGRRRGSGSYYTPAWLVEHLAELVTSGSLGAVLDPACGAGAFLVAMLRRGRDDVWGVDGDPLAVLAARRALVGAGLPVAEALRRVRCGDGLLDADLHDRFDLVIGNPPWGLAFGPAYRRRLAAAGLLDPGEPSSEAAFLRASQRQVRPGGRVAFVLPESWLSTRRGEPLRRWLLRSTRLERIEVWRKGVFGGARDMVPVVLVAARAQPSGGTTVAWHGLARPLLADPAALAERAVDTRCWTEEPGGVFALGQGPDLPTTGGRLYEVATLHDGFYKSHLRLGTGAQPVLTAGRQLQPFRLAPLASLERVEAASLVAAELARQRRPKVLVHAMRKPALAQRIVAAADADGAYLASNNLLLVIPRDGCPWSVAALAALLNSGPLNAWYAARFIQVNIEAFTLGAVPLPPFTMAAEAWLAKVGADTPAAELDAFVAGLYGTHWERLPA